MMNDLYRGLIKNCIYSLAKELTQQQQKLFNSKEKHVNRKDLTQNDRNNNILLAILSQQLITQ